MFLLCTDVSHGAVIVGIPAHSLSASAHQSALNISCPVFVPRGHMTATSETPFRHHSSNLSSEIGVLGSGNPVVYPITSLNSRTGRIITNPYNVVGTLTNSAPSVGVYNETYANGDGTLLTTNNLPQQFANITLGQSQWLPVWSQSARRRRDASSQTVPVNMVNACTGSASLLLMDASTNTPPYDEPCSLQRVPVHAETNVDMQTGHRTTRYDSHPIAVNETSVDPAGINRRSSLVGSLSDRWADCWIQGQSPGSLQNDGKSSCLFSDASKNTVPSATNIGAANSSRHESSSFHSEDFSHMHDTLPETSPLNVHHVHNSCDCSFSDCPFALPAVSQEQNAAMGGGLFATSGQNTVQVNAVS